jgi:hypothetical protein
MPVLDLDHDEAPGGHGYAVSMQCLFVRLVLQGVSLRGVPRVLAVLAEAFGWSLSIPHWTTGRLWLLRLGHALLTAALEKAEDWGWLIDHSVQIGQEKCLVIVGIRLRDLPKPGICLRHADMQLIALVPRKSWTRQEVDEQLEAASRRTGIPRVIVDDHGVDVAGGVRFFQERHPESVEIYDAKHKAACLLKGRLQKNPRWQEFHQRIAQTRCAIQQTELAFLVPPGPKPKARFMNLEPTLQWAKKVLAVVQEPPAVVRERVRPERLQEKLGWLQEYAADMAEWSEWQQVANVTVEFVNRQGVYRGAAKQLWTELLRYQVHASSQLLAKELVVFVAKQASRMRSDERFPGSTEVLESCFGRFKQLEKQQARGGFTSLVLGFGALLAETTTKVIREAMQHSRTKDIFTWCQEHLGTTLFGQRKLAFAASATKDG